MKIKQWCDYCTAEICMDENEICKYRKLKKIISNSKNKVLDIYPAPADIAELLEVEPGTIVQETATPDGSYITEVY